MGGGGARGEGREVGWQEEEEEEEEEKEGRRKREKEEEEERGRGGKRKEGGDGLESPFITHRRSPPS